MGKVISDCLEKGDPIPDNIVNFQVEKRLKQSDCKVNGWVLEGFPYTRPQMNMLKALRIRPSHCFVFEMQEDECVRRLSNRRIDPQSGKIYNIEVNQPTDETITNRLITQPADEEAVVRKLYGQWRDQQPIIEDHFRYCLNQIQSEREILEMKE